MDSENTRWEVVLADHIERFRTPPAREVEVEEAHYLASMAQRTSIAEHYSLAWVVEEEVRLAHLDFLLRIWKPVVLLLEEAEVQEVAPGTAEGVAGHSVVVGIQQEAL